MQHLPSGQRPRQADNPHRQESGRPVDCPRDFPCNHPILTRIVPTICGSMQTADVASNKRKSDKYEGEFSHDQPECRFEKKRASSPRETAEFTREPKNEHRRPFVEATGPGTRAPPTSPLRDRLQTRGQESCINPKHGAATRATPICVRPIR